MTTMFVQQGYRPALLWGERRRYVLARERFTKLVFDPIPILARSPARALADQIPIADYSRATDAELRAQQQSRGAREELRTLNVAASYVVPYIVFAETVELVGPVAAASISRSVVTLGEANLAFADRYAERVDAVVDAELEHRRAAIQAAAKNAIDLSTAPVVRDPNGGGAICWLMS